jgi:hypothetical protein
MDDGGTDREIPRLLSAYAEDALVAGRYDFQMGRKLRNYLERSGFIVSTMLTLEDQELSFSGPGRPEGWTLGELGSTV